MIDRIDELELAARRSGRDEFSNLKLPALATLRPQETAQIATQLPLEEEQRAAIRWVLRGLSVERAVAKVAIDREMKRAIRDKRRLKKELNEGLGMDADELRAWLKANNK